MISDIRTNVHADSARKTNAKKMCVNARFRPFAYRHGICIMRVFHMRVFDARMHASRPHEFIQACKHPDINASVQVLARNFLHSAK
jgi:hypothetical protein